MTGYNFLLEIWKKLRIRFIGCSTIAVGIVCSSCCLDSILRNHRTLITRVVNGQILKRVGRGVTGILMASIRFATLGQERQLVVPSAGLDRADGRLDGYILA